MLKNEILRLQQHEVSPISWSLETFLSNHLDLTRRLRSHKFLLLLREVRDSKKFKHLFATIEAVSVTDI